MYKEVQDILDGVFPYCLIVLLPLMIIISPKNPVEAVSSEFQVHRLAQMKTVDGIYVGSKVAGVTLDARALGAKNILRKIVVTRLNDLSVAKYAQLVTSGVGAILILISPSSNQSSSETAELEGYLTNLEVENELSGIYQPPSFFAYETPVLTELLEHLQKDMETENDYLGEKRGIFSALRALTNNVYMSGFQLVTNHAVPKPLVNQRIISLYTHLTGFSMASDDKPFNQARDVLLPTILVVAHYDTQSVAPGMPSGADSNGSGLTVVMELVRLFSHLYKISPPPANLAFLLSGGGKLNFFGTKKWIEETLANDDEEFAFVACLDSFGGAGSLTVHVSKPPKAESAAGKFLSHLGQAQMIHKKINLAQDSLAWEHERFSIQRISAFTLSSHASSESVSNSLLDTSINETKLVNDIRIIAEALVCNLYRWSPNETWCSGQIFTGGLEPQLSHVKAWTDFLASTPRSMASILSSSSSFVTSLKSALVKMLPRTAFVKESFSEADKRDPAFIFYDGISMSMNVYSVKPAIFDLFISAFICLYCGFIYLVIVFMATLDFHTLSRRLFLRPVKGSSPVHSTASSRVDTGGAVIANGHRSRRNKLALD